ncbi:MAG: DUF2164 domain-containing protein [Gammaproteobacteria bacterium]|nr:DUF2164 domain-containing protein [Gammaproteobacteria bacterium]MDD9895986.1 DUF2164 domain-containing protein [Gammaproteobacteria bacterium]MDD9960054.1 DUF2164 domain-containing protein [Gammaproteobacteria bacterium]
MSKIELDQSEKDEIAKKLKDYLAEELGIEVGIFDAQFLLDFFTEQIGYRFYNQGLVDVLKAFEGKLEEFNDLIYQLEQDRPA